MGSESCANGVPVIIKRLKISSHNRFTAVKSKHASTAHKMILKKSAQSTIWRATPREASHRMFQQKNYSRQAIFLLHVGITNIFYFHVLNSITRAHDCGLVMTVSVCHHFTPSALVALFSNQSLYWLATHSTFWRTASEVNCCKDVVIVDVKLVAFLVNSSFRHQWRNM